MPSNARPLNPILTEILSGAWLINSERSAAYASLLISLLKGERFSEQDSTMAREKNRPFILSASGDGWQRQPFSGSDLPDGSVAVIPIRSEILKYDQPCGPRGTQSIITDIRMADQNPSVGSILLVVDSPGGQVTGTDLLADAIRSSSTPVVAYIEGMAASAAYWIISGASRIIASSTLDRVGSIGTMLMVEDLKPALEKLGVKFHEVYASLSTDKNQDFKELLQGNYDPIRSNLLDVINTKFIDTIKSARPNLDASALTGKIYFAPEAITLGLIDEIGSMDYAISLADQLSREKKNQLSMHANQKPETMTIKNTWKAIRSFFRIDPASQEPQELTEERMEQINTQLASLSALNNELELQLQQEKDAHAGTLAELQSLKAQDAATETTAAKAADKIPGNGDETSFSHDRIADDFLA